MFNLFGSKKEKKVSDDFVGILKTILHPDGTKETVRFTKTREVHDVESPDGRKGKVWKSRFH